MLRFCRYDRHGRNHPYNENPVKPARPYHLRSRAPPTRFAPSH